MPVDGIVLFTLSAWLTSSLVALAVGADGAVSAGLTVAVPEAALSVVTGVDAWSVMYTLNV